MKKIAFAALSVSVLLLSACTNIQPSTQTPTTLPTADTPLKFAVTGKIGVVTTTPPKVGKQVVPFILGHKKMIASLLN